MAFELNTDQGLQALDPNQIMDLVQGTSVKTGCTPSYSGTGTDIDIASGTVFIDGAEVSVSSTTVTIRDGDSSPRKDIIIADSNGTISVLEGTPETKIPNTEDRFNTAQPSPPDMDGRSEAVLAEIWVPANATSLSSQDVRDRRVLARTGQYTDQFGMTTTERLVFNDQMASIARLQFEHNLSELAYDGGFFDIFRDTSKINIVSDPYNLSGIVFDAEFDVSTNADAPEDVAVNSDGTKLFVMSGTGNLVSYNLSTAYDISTASFNQIFDASTNVSSPFGLAFNDTGTKMFIADAGSAEVHTYTLSTAFDVSTASFSESNAFSEDGSYGAIDFSDTGDKMYLLGRDNDSVYSYNLSSAFDVSTASFSNSFSLNQGDEGLEIVDNGTKMFIVNNGGTIYRYNLSSAYDISTASLDSTADISNNSIQPSGVLFNGTGDIAFVSDDDTNNDDIVQYIFETEDTQNVTVSTLESGDSNGTVSIAQSALTDIETVESGSTRLGWEDNQYFSINSASEIYGTYSLEITGGEANETKTFEEPLQTGDSFKISVKISSFDIGNFDISVDDSDSGPLISLRNDANGNLESPYSGNIIVNDVFSPDTVVDMEFVPDLSANTYDVYIDGTLEETDVPIQNTSYDPEKLDEVTLSSSGGYKNLFVDNFTTNGALGGGTNSGEVNGYIRSIEVDLGDDGFTSGPSAVVVSQALIDELASGEDIIFVIEDVVNNTSHTVTQSEVDTEVSLPDIESTKIQIKTEFTGQDTNTPELDDEMFHFKE